MTHRIFTLTEKAKKEEMDWDTAIYNHELETVKEFESYDDAVRAFEDGGYDPDLYGAE